MMFDRTAAICPFAEPHRAGASLRRHTRAGSPSTASCPSSAERSYDAKPTPPPPGPKSPIEGTPLGVSFVDVVKESGLAVKTIYGGEGKNKYLLETTGCGLAFYDYDQDGWLDIFLVNGWRLEGFPGGQEPRCHLFKNNRDGTFTDVTKGSGLEHGPAGARPAASAITTTTATTTCLSLTTARTRSIATTATAPSPT